MQIEDTTSFSKAQGSSKSYWSKWLLVGFVGLFFMLLQGFSELTEQHSFISNFLLPHPGQKPQSWCRVCNLNSILPGIQQLYIGAFDIKLYVFVLALRLSHSGLIFPTLMNEFIFPRKWSSKTDTGNWPKIANPPSLSPSFLCYAPAWFWYCQQIRSVKFSGFRKKRKKSLFEITVTFLIKRFLSPN